MPCTIWAAGSRESGWLWGERLSPIGLCKKISPRPHTKAPETRLGFGGFLPQGTAAGLVAEAWVAVTALAGKGRTPCCRTTAITLPTWAATRCLTCAGAGRGEATGWHVGEVGQRIAVAVITRLTVFTRGTAVKAAFLRAGCAWGIAVGGGRTLTTVIPCKRVARLTVLERCTLGGVVRRMAGCIASSMAGCITMWVTRCFAVTVAKVAAGVAAVGLRLAITPVATAAALWALVAVATAACTAFLWA